MEHTIPNPDKVAAAKALFGILPNDVDLSQAQEERLLPDEKEESKS